MMNPETSLKITIITVCFNSAETIADTIESVNAQDYMNTEHVIIDGGSTDNTMSIVNSHSKPGAIIISEKDSGIYDAMNKGLACSTGDVIAILNSDDIYASNTEISTIAELFGKNPNIPILFGHIIFKDFNTEKVLRFVSGTKFKPYKLRFGWMPPHPSTFVRKHVYDEFGPYSLDFKISADYERFVKWLFVEKIPYKAVDRVFVHMRMGGVSTSNLASILLLNSEIVKACRLNGVYTNRVLLLLKLPLKLLEFVSKPTGDSKRKL